MKFGFTDSSNIRYAFELGAEPAITEPHVEVTIYLSVTGLTRITTIRYIRDEKVVWRDPYYDSRISLEARRYLDKVIKNKTFL
jgi:hypothetical protein